MRLFSRDSTLDFVIVAVMPILLTTVRSLESREMDPKFERSQPAERSELEAAHCARLSEAKALAVHARAAAGANFAKSGLNSEIALQAHHSPLFSDRRLNAQLHASNSRLIFSN